jgi:hypothetical protein
VELQLDRRLAAQPQRHHTSTINSPRGGRAPGWNAGLVVAERELTATARY